MKKLTTVFAGFLLLLLTSSFAFTDSTVNARIKSVFEKDFAAGSDVKWTKAENVYVATFTVNGNYQTAAYDEEGKLICIGRYIGQSQLPLKVSRAMEEKYGSYTIDPSIIEVSADQTSYFFNVENEKFIMKIKSDASGFLSVESKTKKKTNNG